MKEDPTPAHPDAPGEPRSEDEIRTERVDDVAEATADARPLAPGRAGEARYEVGASLGKGGMGEVVEVLDHEFNRRVAMKTLLYASPTKETVELFVAEAQINSQLEHPNMVPVHDIGVGADGRPYFTMRLVRG
ncbi:MAG: protein kinase, partial [Myxococcota bacterium]|nr:protein kinase [Myxococcota bacterium]